MNRKIIVPLIIILGVSIVAETFWISQQFDELDTSWIGTVTQHVEEAKPLSNPENVSLLFFFRIYLFENGTEQLIFGHSLKLDFVTYLENLLPRINQRTNTSVSEVFIDEILGSDKVLALKYRVYSTFHVWKNLDTALFVLEDNLGYGLKGTIIIRQVIKGHRQWSSWRIMK